MALSTDNIDVPNRDSIAWSVAPGNYNAQIDDFSLRAGASIAPFRAVKFGTDDLHVIQGAAATDLTIGIYQGENNALAENEVMVAFQGLGRAECGATVVRGDLLTVDAQGRVVASLVAPTDRVIGVALQSGTVGVVIRVSIAPSKNGGIT